jgi:DNA (cytosine-5)-methyltransferase 1
VKSEKAMTLKASGGDLGGGSENLVMQKSVRRLTPTECERLQGLPDGYTDIEYNGKPAPDSKRYKALGNGMAQPVADWVIKRIVEVSVV